MFVLLFAFVFGGSINVPGVDYKEWLLPGIMAQTMAFSSFVVAIGLNNDLGKGIVDRFRSLPIVARGGAGGAQRLQPDPLQPRHRRHVAHRALHRVAHPQRPAEGLLGYGLLVLFGFMMIWIGILVGSSLRSVEAVQGVMFVTIFPITFLTNAFAPPEGMPPVLRWLAEWNPITRWCRRCASCGATASRCRPTPRCRCSTRCSSTLIWTVGLAAVLAPLSLRVFRNRTQQ